MPKGFWNSSVQSDFPRGRIFVEIATNTDPQQIEKVEAEVAFAMGRCGLTHSGQTEPLEAYKRKWNKEQEA